MKGTESFKSVIQSYLELRAEVDELFAVSFTKENKSIDECITYILSEVQRSGCGGFCDEEIFSMAVHYYDEDDIEVGSPANCNVVVNHVVELTEEEKEKARRDAIKRIEQEHYKKMTAKSPKPKRQEQTTTLSLFEF
ncbi:MAG: PcfK-like family protein [Rikenellaceae bacterium]